MIDPETLKLLVRNGSFASDGVAIGLRVSGATGAEITRAIIAHTLEALEANGLITVVPSSEWPEYFAPDPPYKGFFG